MRRGWIFLILWAVLILVGIVEKRIFDHPDRMMLYHFPAAVCLVLAMYDLSRKFRQQYQREMEHRGYGS